LPSGAHRLARLLIALLVWLCPLVSVQGAELATRGAVQCPPAEELAFRVERAIGMPLAQAAPLRLRVNFETGRRPGARYTARVEVDGDEPTPSHLERQLGAESCAELGAAVSVALALALGADEATPAAPIPPPEPPRAGSTSQAEPSRVPAAEDARALHAEHEPGTLTPVLTLALVGDTGSLPAPGLGLALGAELRWQRLALRAAGTLLFDQHAELQPPIGSSGGINAAIRAPGADLSLALGSLSACTTVFGGFRAPFAAAVCAGWELGRLSAVGTGIQIPRRGAALWSAPRVDAGLSWAASGTPLRLGFQLGVLTPLTRDDFFLRDLGTVHRPPSVVGRLAVGVDVSFE
jgi:hypothetical protein